MRTANRTVGLALLFALLPAAAAQVPAGRGGSAGQAPAPSGRGAAGKVGRLEHSREQEKRRVSRGVVPGESDLAGVAAGPSRRGAAVRLDREIELGDTVRGVLDRSEWIRIGFVAARGAALEITLDTEKGDAPVKPVGAVLLDAAGAPLAVLAAERPGAAGGAARRTLVIDALERSGAFLLEITTDSALPARFTLATSVRLPERQEFAVEFADGRPLSIPIGGAPGRVLARATVRRLDADAARLALRLTSPAGPAAGVLPLEETARRDWSGRVVAFGPVPLDAAGDYELTLADLSRANGRGKVTLEFSNPPPGRAIHVLGSGD